MCREHFKGDSRKSSGFQRSSWVFHGSFKVVSWKFQRCFKEVPRCFKEVAGMFQGNFKSVLIVLHDQFNKVSRGLLSRFPGGFQKGFRGFHRTLKCVSRVF